METPMKGGSTLAMAVSGSPMHVRNGGAGQDFVLFDENRQQPSVLMPSRGIGESSSTTMTSRPSFESKPSFTEYRAAPQSIPQNESPFSSPASKHEDDFGSDQGHGSDAMLYGDRGSGTLEHGTPKSKRQRGHGYSSSWTGGNLQQHRHQSRQPSGGTLASAMDPSHSYSGYGSSVKQQGNWSGSETSPQIHSLSLGDGTDVAGTMSSLFPGSSAAAAAMKPANNSSMSLQSGYQMPPSSSFSFSSPSQQQNQRAREQIRNDLMGVDSRALKGPLRDIQQGMMQDAIGQNLYSNLDFSTFQPNAFYTGGQNRSVMPPPGPTRQRSGSLDTSFLSSSVNYSSSDNNTGNFDTSQIGWNIGGSFSNDINAFDLQGLDDYRSQKQQQQHLPTPSMQRQSHLSQSLSPPSRPDLQDRQFSTRTQQAVDRARAQSSTRKRMTRDGSGLTISPQEAFLDYNDIDSLIQVSRSLSQSHYTNAPQNLFAAPPPSIEDALHSDSLVMTPKAASYERSGQYNPISSLTSAHEGTPSLVDASSNSSNGSRATSVINSPLQRMPLNREDTVRPSKSQQALLSQQSNSTGNLFSPAYSTTSSTDDEDEKPYEPNSSQQSNPPGWQFPFPAQSKQGAGAGASHQASHSGPRFSVVSSSSSESEDDDQRGRGGKSASTLAQGRRTMGGYGYMGSSQESGLNASTSSFSSWQPVQSLQLQEQHQQQQQQQHHHHHAQLHQQSMQPMGTSKFSSPLNAQSGVNKMGLDRTPRSAGGNSDNQSQDDAPSLSPLIRSSAQAIPQGGDSRHSTNIAGAAHTPTNNQTRQRSRSRNRAQVQHAAPVSAHVTTRRTPSEASNSSSSFEETSEWETGEESEADGSDYNEASKGANSNGPKNIATTRKRRRGGATTRQGAGSGTHSSATSASHLTVCDYVSPLTGESCKTEFHRPYDLARHRETIHAREEALLLRQGRIKKEQCIVLYREVDPAKSLATVEWKCEGRNGCGSLFSRKDALLRHKRIRGH